jgi:rRNA maturation endonuclease Nob1
MTQDEIIQMALPCCGYTDASAVRWNSLNGVLQCHNCGQIYTHPPQRTEQNFCSRCGKRTTDLTAIHTCTPPQDKT